TKDDAAQFDAMIKKSSNQGNQGCFVATAVYGNYDCPEVRVLRRFRDQVLARTHGGRILIRAYYATSPTLVRGLGQRGWFVRIVRPMLDAMVSYLTKRGLEGTAYVDPTDWCHQSSEVVTDQHRTGRRLEAIGVEHEQV